MASCDASPRQRCSPRWCSTGSNAQRSLRAQPLSRPSSLRSRRQPASQIRLQLLKAPLPQGARSLRWKLGLALTRLPLSPHRSRALSVKSSLSPWSPARTAPQRLRPRPSEPSIRKPWTGPARPTPASRPSRRRPARRQLPSRSRALQPAAQRSPHPYPRARRRSQRLLQKQRLLPSHRRLLSQRLTSSRCLLPSRRSDQNQRPQTPPQPNPQLPWRKQRLWLSPRLLLASLQEPSSQRWLHPSLAPS